MAAKTKSMKQDTSAGKNKQGVTTKNGDVSQEISDMEALVSERKLYLQKEYKTLTDHVNAYMGTVEHFLQENKFLEKEAKQNEEESNAYLSYITKHSQKCQNMIITLNDQNHTDLSQVQKEKEELISQYTEKEKEVRSRLTNVETKYSVMSKEVEDLQPFRAPSLQLEQRKKIKELEKELLVTKVRYADQMHTIKSRFLKAKADCELDFQQKMQFLTKRAEEAAILSLIQHIQQVKAENCRLRQELLSLIQYSTILKETKAELLDQQEQLLREQQYLQDVAQARRCLHGAHGANSASRSPRRCLHGAHGANSASRSPRRCLHGPHGADSASRSPRSPRRCLHGAHGADSASRSPRSPRRSVHGVHGANSASRSPRSPRRSFRCAQ